MQELVGDIGYRVLQPLIMGEGNIWLWFAGQLITAGAIWGALRADVKGLGQRVDRLEKAQDRKIELVDEITIGGTRRR